MNCSNGTIRKIKFPRRTLGDHGGWARGDKLGRIRLDATRRIIFAKRRAPFFAYCPKDKEKSNLPEAFDI